MAQSFDLYVDTYSGKSVTSDTNNTPAPLPRFIQGDTFTLKIYLLSRTKDFPQGDNSDPANPKPPYLIINNADLSLKAALGIKDGIPASTLYTQQFTWDKGSDPGFPSRTFFTATFPMNTSLISDLIGAKANAQAWFELEVTDSGLPWTVMQELVTIQAEVIDTNVVVVPPGLTAMSVEQALATFLKRQVKGIIYLEDINNPGQFIALFNENGSLQEQNVGGTLPP